MQDRFEPKWPQPSKWLLHRANEIHGSNPKGIPSFFVIPFRHVCGKCVGVGKQFIV